MTPTLNIIARHDVFDPDLERETSLTDARERDWIAGFTWDVGGHVMFSHYKYYDQCFEDLMGKDYQLAYHLAPPSLAKKNARGELQKQRFGPWMLPAFRVLARMNFSSPSFIEIELTIALPCTHFRPASITLHLELSIMSGIRQISGSLPTSRRKRVMAASESIIPSSMLISRMLAPPATC